MNDVVAVVGYEPTSPIQNIGGIDNAQPVGTAATRPRRTLKRPGYLQEYEVEYQ